LTLVLGSVACERQSRQISSPGTPAGPTTAVCSITVTSARTRFNQLGGQTTLTITTLPNCGWQVTIPAWIQVTPVASGTGNARLTMAVAPYVLPREAYVQVDTQSTLIQQEPDGEVGPMNIRPYCIGPVRAGSLLTCFVAVDPGTTPASSGLEAFVDARQIAGAERWTIGRCPACGYPPATFDLGVTLPAQLSPGLKTLVFFATDKEGRAVTVTETIEVIPK
jgi:hypothetical protein